jgi:hypothetical protein
MSAANTTAPELTLTLSAEERAQLLSVLEQAHRDTLVEDHRTESSDYRQHVQRRESVLRGLIDKLRGP